MLTANELGELIGRVSLGDRQAFDRLYAHSSAKLFGVVLRLLRNRTDAEDAVQEVYVKIWQKADSYAASRASPMSWLIAIARNHAIDRLRTRKPHSDIDAAAEVADEAPSPEASAVLASERSRIEKCMEELDPPKADAVRGAYLDGYSYQELADRFEVPINTMRTWLRRSLMTLKGCLGG